MVRVKARWDSSLFAGDLGWEWGPTKDDKVVGSEQAPGSPRAEVVSEIQTVPHAPPSPL